MRKIMIKTQERLLLQFKRLLYLLMKQRMIMRKIMIKTKERLLLQLKKLLYLLMKQRMIMRKIMIETQERLLLQLMHYHYLLRKLTDGSCNYYHSTLRSIIFQSRIILWLINYRGCNSRICCIGKWIMISHFPGK